MAVAERGRDKARILRMTRRFEAPCDKVFRAFVEPDQLLKWWGPTGMQVTDHLIDVQVGGAWRTTMRSKKGEDYTVSGVYREITPPVRLVLTWGWERDGERGHETIVTIELAEQDGGTRLDLTQELFDSEEMRDSHGSGWSESLDCLEEALTKGDIR